MSRANVADVSAQAEARRNFAFFRPVIRSMVTRMTDASKIAFDRLQPSRHASGSFAPATKSNLNIVATIAAMTRRIDQEIFARWAVPVAVLVFLGAIAIASIVVTVNDQDRMIGAATTDLDLIATVIANDIDLRLHDEPDMTPAQALAHALPARAMAKNNQQVLLSDQTGRIVATYPSTATVQKTVGADTISTVADVLGASQPLTVFAEKAGVMRIMLPGGTEVLATVRSLREPLGQVAVLHPIGNVLNDWRTTLVRTIVLLGAIAAVLAALAIAYLWQATKARQANSFCRKMRDRVDMVLASGRCGLWDWNLASGHVDWSLSMYEIIGMTPTDKALSFAEIDGMIHPDDGGLDAIAQKLRAGSSSPTDHVFRIRNSRDQWSWMRAKMELVKGEGGTPHLVGIAIDITETMALEERTARADMRLRDAIETISEAFVVWDADNRLVMCNSKFQRFNDLPAEAVVFGTPYAAVMERGTPPLVQSQVALGIPQPMGARTFEAQLGDGRWLQINERRTKDGGYVSVGTDITALKRNEEQLIESERRLMGSVVDLRKSRQILETQAQQLAELAEKYLEQKAQAENANRAKSDFLANMGHELRTPLNAILGFSEIMMLEAYGGLGSPLYSEYCKDIHTSGQYLLGVIADVLEMSRLEAGRVVLAKEDFAIENTIQAAVASIAATAQANGITIESKASPHTRLHADRPSVEKILAILLHNAVKYTPATGRVTVRTHIAQGALNIIVEDTGVGIAPEAIERLGRPFEQLDLTLSNGMRGSGLGLAIARSLIDLHGGAMQINSQQGSGTTVVVSLPNQQRGALARPKLAAITTGPAIHRATTRQLQTALHALESGNSKISRSA